jgi:hypothetical protein
MKVSVTDKRTEHQVDKAGSQLSERARKWLKR